MNNVRLTTRNTNGQYKTLGIVSAALTCVIGIAVLIGYAFLSSKSSDGSLIFILFMGLLLLGDGLVTIAVKCFFSSSYVDIYEDRVEGKGIQKFSVLQFAVKRSEINNITSEGIFIHIHTTSGTYKIISDKKTAAEVFSYYNQTMRT